MQLFGQVLPVTECIRFAQRCGAATTIVRADDITYSAPSRGKQHGAQAEHFLTHLALREREMGSTPNDWGLHVTDQEYRAVSGVG